MDWTLQTVTCRNMQAKLRKLNLGDVQVSKCANCQSGKKKSSSFVSTEERSKCIFKGMLISPHTPNGLILLPPSDFRSISCDQDSDKGTVSYSFKDDRSTERMVLREVYSSKHTLATVDLKQVGQSKPERLGQP